jgi:hypothetical protein
MPAWPDGQGILHKIFLAEGIDRPGNFMAHFITQVFIKING